MHQSLQGFRSDVRTYYIHSRLSKSDSLTGFVPLSGATWLLAIHKSSRRAHLSIEATLLDNRHELSVPEAYKVPRPLLKPPSCQQSSG